MPDTNRRDFVKFLALLAAGSAALPQQIEAFEKYYEANTPIGPVNLIAIDEIFISGMATASIPLRCNFYKNDQSSVAFAVNLFGGVVRWSAMPDQKLISSEEDFYWDFIPQLPVIEFQDHFLVGTISYINSKYQRKIAQITKLRGSLIDP